MNDEHKYSAGATIKDKDFFFFFFPLFFTTHTILFIVALCTSLKIFTCCTKDKKRRKSY